MVGPTLYDSRIQRAEEQYDVNDPVLIDANTLSHPDDPKAALPNIELCREIGNNAAFSKLVKREAIPGNLGNNEMENFARNAAVTFWHQCGTAKKIHGWASRSSLHGLI